MAQRSHTLNVISWRKLTPKYRSSVRFIVFDKHANIVAQHQLEFPQYYPNPGCIWTSLDICSDLSFLCLSRWHDHDANEIQQHADLCIDETIKRLEAAGWAKNSVKVIGKSVSDRI